MVAKSGGTGRGGAFVCAALALASAAAKMSDVFWGAFLRGTDERVSASSSRSLPS